MTRPGLGVILAILLATPCFAQMNYENNGTASGYQAVNDIPNCGANNCWHLPPQQSTYQGTNQLIAISVGSDGYVCGITGGQTIICHTEYPSNTWSSLPAQLSGVTAISVGSQSDIWALSGTCLTDLSEIKPLAGHAVWQMSGGSWVQRSGCGLSIAVDEASWSMSQMSTVVSTSAPLAGCRGLN